MSTAILSIIPGLMFTKIAVSNDENIVYQCKIDHSDEDFILFDNIIDQLSYRKDAILAQLRNDRIDTKSIDYVVAEGGLLRPCKSGVYAINKNMVADLMDGISGDDIINIGALLAFTIANTFRIKSFVVDPASVDECSDLAKFSVHPALKKKSLFHAMIHKYLSRKYAESVNENYENLNIIFCHVGDRSVSVAAHENGKVVDVNQAYMGDGPMGFYEIGTVPTSNVMDMLFKKVYPKDEIIKLIKQNGTFNYYLGTNSEDEILNLFKNNDKKTKSILEVMAYQISKEIASHYATLNAKIDVVILSGKIFSDNRFFKYISKRIEKLAPIKMFSDDYTLEAMVFSVLRCLNKNTDLNVYDWK